MASRFHLLFVVWVALEFPNQLSGQKCVAPDRESGVNFPEMFNLGTSGQKYSSYKLITETNLLLAEKTIYTTEYYDRDTQSGMLDIEMDGNRTRINYFGQTNEIFEAAYKKFTCTTSLLSDLDENKNQFTTKYGGWNWVSIAKNQAHIGPSNIMQTAFNLWKNGAARMGKEPGQQKVRGMDTNVWTWCAREGDITVKFFFTDPKTEKPYGLEDMNVPVRLTVDGIYNGATIKESFDFVGFSPNVEKTELALALAIPVSIGCQRKAKDTKVVPTYDGKSVFVEAEIVYTPFINNSPEFSYVTNIKIVVDQVSKHTAVQFTPWRAHQDAEMAAPGDNIMIVVDAENDYVYIVDKITDNCTINDIRGDDLHIVLPDGQKLSIGDSEVFLLASNSSEFHYLGEAIERGIPANVFEKSVFDPTTLAQKIVTRYHIGDDTLLNNDFQEQQAPLKVVYWSMDFDNAQILTSVVVNFFSFNSRLTKKYQYFDVTPCFQEDSQSQWFQLTFPMNNYVTDQVIPQIPYIQENFLGVLNTVALLESPLRFPKIIADVDSENLYLTGLLLERPRFLMDFVKTDQKKKLKLEKDNAVVKGIMSLDNCAKACLEESFCKHFSYCGAICTTAVSEIDESSDLMEEDGCAFYKSDRRGLSIPTMSEVNLAISSAVADRTLILELPMLDKSGGVMTFTAVSFKSEIAFGIEGLVRKPEGNIDTRFSVFIWGGKLIPFGGEDIRNLGKLSFQTCKQACVMRETCQSFSHCLATSECLITEKHSEDISSQNIQLNSQCAIFNRNYEDYFDRNPGISLAHEAELSLGYETVEACAMACIKEKSFKCRSFDMCPSATSTGRRPCLLHKEHFMDFQEKEHLTVDEKCGHYSKKFVYDFTMTRLKEMVDPGNTVTMFNVSTEQCSKNCLESSGQWCQRFDFCTTVGSFQTRCVLAGIGKGDLKDSGSCNNYAKGDTTAKSMMLNPRHKRSKPAEDVVSRPEKEMIPAPEKEARLSVETMIRNPRDRAVHEPADFGKDFADPPATNPPPAKEEGHSKSATGGLAFLMFLIGLAVGVGGIYAFGYYRANRK